MIEYELIYDAARDFAGWQIVAGWLLLFAFFLTVTFKTDRIPHFVFWLMRLDETDTGWGRTIIFLAVLILGIISVAIISQNLKLRSLSKNNDCAQVAGVVLSFKGRTAVGQYSQIRLHRESFKLNDLEFEYDTAFMVTGFNKAADHGGPIYEGAKVRLCYIEQIENRKKERKIIRVEKALVQSND